MSGTIAGGAKTAQTIKAKYGGDYYRRLGALGGAASNTGGFFGNPELARRAGKLGGGISKPAWTPERKARHGQMMRQKWAERKQAEQLFVPDNTDFNEGFNRPSRFKTLMDRMMK